MKKLFFLLGLILLFPLSVKAQPGVCNSGSARYPIALDISVVTTGGVSVIALKAGHAKCGGWIVTSNSAGICVDQANAAGTTTGTPSTTSCVGANVPFYLFPSSGPVSVNSSGSSVTFGGLGLN